MLTTSDMPSPPQSRHTHTRLLTTWDYRLPRAQHMNSSNKKYRVDAGLENMTIRTRGADEVFISIHKVAYFERLNRVLESGEPNLVR